MVNISEYRHTAGFTSRYRCNLLSYCIRIYAYGYFSWALQRFTYNVLGCLSGAPVHLLLYWGTQMYIELTNIWVKWKFKASDTEALHLRFIYLFLLIRMHVCLSEDAICGWVPEEAGAGSELPNLAAKTKLGSSGRAARAVSLWASLQLSKTSLELEANLEKSIPCFIYWWCE